MNTRVSPLVRAGAATAVTDGLFSSVLAALFYGSTVSRLFQGVASTLLGASAFDGGTRTALVGVLMHVGVAFGWSAVFNADEAALHWAPLNGTQCKNLFLRNKKGDRHYLVVLEISKRADLKRADSKRADLKRADLRPSDPLLSTPPGQFSKPRSTLATRRRSKPAAVSSTRVSNARRSPTPTC